ncbi:MAG: histone deacetylase [Deltaproteobacteria bacterium]|nr:histone deacetylase [Deltaproteobacteria bacterium]
MGLVQRALSWLRAAPPLPLWYHRDYRLPLPEVEARVGVEPRRADLVAWYLLEKRIVTRQDVREPARIGYGELARAHSQELLESLTRPETLARVFAVEPAELPVDEILRTVRLACGATLEAARKSLLGRCATLNLLGGFHHAARARASGFCPVNDIAVAVAALRKEGFSGRVAVLDLDAHPPDGTADCFHGDRSVWIGSISGCTWEPLDGVDENVLPVGCPDREYLDVLGRLLGRMPRPDLAFVIAGGDVLAGDRFGKLGLTLGGARRRDACVAKALTGTPSVWLPGGGYHADAWKVLAGTALVLAGRGAEPIPLGHDPLHSRFGWLASTLSRESLSGKDTTESDILEQLGVPSQGPARLLGFYSAEGIECAFFRYGILDHLQRLGYAHFRFEMGPASVGERLRALGSADGRDHMLLEVVLERATVSESTVLFVHWLALRHPRVPFGPDRPKLPGQDAPGLGLAREAMELLGRMADRLGLEGVVIRPAWYHVAFSARHRLRFVDPARQGRFEALVRDLAHLTLLQATLAVVEGRVVMNGSRYSWEADDMALWLNGRQEDRASVEEELSRVHFSAWAPPSQ